MVAVDLRGYGPSDAPREVDCYTMDLLMTDIRDIIQGLGVDAPRPPHHAPSRAPHPHARTRAQPPTHPRPLLQTGISNPFPPHSPSHPPGYSKCILVGHDWGSLLAWNFSIYFPSLVERMVVVSAAPMSVYQGGLLSLGHNLCVYLSLFPLPPTTRCLGAWECQGWRGGQGDLPSVASPLRKATQDPPGWREETPSRGSSPAGGMTEQSWVWIRD